MRWPSQRTLTRALALLIVLVAVSQIAFYFCRTVDDMFISLRYASRLVAGDGLTYNDGARVEGFSNPSWVVLQALLIWLGVDGVLGTKLLSVASYALLLLGVYRFGRENLGLERPYALAAVLLNVACSYVASWALWGLETPLFVALIIWFPVLLRRQVRAPSAPSAVLLAFVATLSCATRPEAPLYLLAVGLASLIPEGAIPWGQRLRALVWPALLTTAATSALLLWRFQYYGQWLPQTYFAKQGMGMDLERLAPLASQGATAMEGVYLVGAIALAMIFASKLRVITAIFLANLFFVASVAVDWMPNHRHFLPLIAFAPFPWLWLMRFGSEPLRWRGSALTTRVVVVTVLAVVAVQFFRVDVRFSVNDYATHGRGSSWVRHKSVESVRDAIDGLSRTPPSHIASMNVEHLGMIAQLFRVIEASSEPERESWFIGRDIGRVGYYSPVQVFDTAGLFTPAVTASEPWIQRETIDDALVTAAFARQPVATDLLDSWGSAAARDPAIMAAYEVLRGSPRAPVALRPIGLAPPGPLEALRRYERVAEAFHTPFYQATLYGESVGAAVEKRYDWIRPQLLVNIAKDAALPSDLQPNVPTVLGERQIELAGCRQEPCPAAVCDGPQTGERVVLACYWRALRPVERNWRVFVHLLDAADKRVALADHRPGAGFSPTTRWPVGEWVRDAVIVSLPPASRPAQVRTGLFIDGERMKAPAGRFVDADGRVRGPTLR